MVESAGHASLIGRKLGNYAVEKLLGRGATGAVYLARDLALGRPVALKVLLGSLARSPEQVTRFLEEARAVAPLQHPHIVGVYEAGVRDGTPFIAMEYIRGEALDRFFRRNAPLHWRHALYIAAQVVEALQCAHQLGVVHRDVKPANILLDRNGHLRLTDFGIARMQQDAVQHGQRYAFFGTPDYMSPEQCGSTVSISHRSDFFSLGVMLYQAMTGTMPFQAENAPALVHKIVNDTPTRLNRIREDIPDDVARLVAGLMEKSPERRPASAAAILTEIARIQHQDGGASALPEAFNAFVREMTAPETPQPALANPGKKQGAWRVRPERKRLAPVSGFAQAVLAAMVLCAIVGTVYWHALEAPNSKRPAAELDQVPIRPASDGRLWAALPSPHWLVETIHWVGDENVALVTVLGRPGTAFDGSQGLLAMAPDRGVVYSVGVPIGPMSDPGFGTGQVVVPRPGAMPAGSSQLPLANAFVVPFPVSPAAENRGGGLIQALAQRWNESEPGGNLLFSLDARNLGTGATSPIWPTGTPPVSLAIHPDGHTLCVLLRDPDLGHDYLAERDVRWRNPKTFGPRLTTASDPIDGASLRYSDHGERLAYRRIFDDGESSLWVIDLSTGAPNGIPVATGTLGDFAFGPQGKRIALSRSRGGEDALSFIDTATADSNDGGPGRCGEGSWHPAEPYLLVQAYDEDTEALQVWAVATEAPHGRNRLTTLDGGTLSAPTISRSGRWVATVSDTDRGQAVVFVPWTRSNAAETGRDTQ